MTPSADSSALATRPGWFGRLRSGVSEIRSRAGDWVRHLLAPIDVAVWGGGSAPYVRATYNQRTALSAMAAFAWVRAGVRARCDDVGGLPIVAVTGPEGKTRLPSHPFLRLAKKPSPGVTRTTFLRQLEADLSLCGNAYIWLTRDTPSGEWEMHRLHPYHVTADIVDGRIAGWRYGAERRLSVLEVFHVHDICWEDGLTSIYGESAIRTLHESLVGVQGFRKHAALQAMRGRPDVVLTIDSNSPGQAAVRDVGEQYEENARLGRRAFVVGKGISVDKMSWSPADLQGVELDDRVRDETLAVLRVPPTRAGIAQANFATARAELQDYWSSLLVSDLQMFAEAFTEIAHAVGGPLDAEIRFDTSGVAVLQTSYDQKQARAGFWVQVMGADPAAAAEYEGFKGAPVGKVAPGQSSDEEDDEDADSEEDGKAKKPPPKVKHKPKPDKDLSRQALLERALTLWLSMAAERLQGTEPEVQVELYRLAGVLEMTQLPAGEAMALAHEVASIVCGAARFGGDKDLTEMYPFTAAYARTVAQRACRPAPAATPPELALAAK